MKDDFAKEKAESVLRKINWVQEILNLAQEKTQDPQTADILSSLAFIMESASADAENLYEYYSKP